MCFFCIQITEQNEITATIIGRQHIEAETKLPSFSFKFTFLYQTVVFRFKYRSLFLTECQNYSNAVLINLF